MTQQTKDEAREEILRRWRALPPDERQTIEHAEFFSAALAGELDFRTMGNSRKVILSWLVRDLAGLPPWGNVPPESVTRSMQQATENADRNEPANDDDTDEAETRRHAAE